MGKYQVVASEKAKSDLNEVARSGNKPMMRKIEKLIKELAEHPTTGTGKPELLKGTTGIWSRRIDKKNRLVYAIQDEEVVVLILAALGHYDDK